MQEEIYSNLNKTPININNIPFVNSPNIIKEEKKVELVEIKNLHYLILSTGAYSDYTPIYFVGRKKITKEKFNDKGTEYGDLLIDDFLSRDEKLRGYRPNEKKWMELMEEWIKEQGFIKLPDNIPEINVTYGDLPNSKDYDYNS